jgi:hypothetical protein
MSLILPHKVERIESPFIVACEGFGDACLVEQLLQRRQMENCRVGCPSRTKVAAYLIPGENQTGTLEHLLLQAKFAAEPSDEARVDSFLNCIGKAPLDKPDSLAKMKMSALVAASFPSNPWATVGPLLQSSKNDLVPIDSPHFKPLGDFLAEFCKE